MPNIPSAQVCVYIHKRENSTCGCKVSLLLFKMSNLNIFHTNTTTKLFTSMMQTTKEVKNSSNLRLSVLQDDAKSEKMFDLLPSWRHK